MIIRPVHFVRVIFVYLVVFNITSVHGQSLEDFKVQESKKIDSTILSLQEKNGLAILSLAPNVSYSEFTGLNVGVNLGSIVTYFQQNRRNKIESAKLENQLKENLSSNLDAAYEKEIELKDMVQLLTYDLDILSSKYDLFKLDSLKYSNQEIPISEFTASKINYQIAWKTVFVAIKKIELQIIRFINKYGFRPTDVSLLLQTSKTYELKS